MGVSCGEQCSPQDNHMLSTGYPPQDMFSTGYTNDLHRISVFSTGHRCSPQDIIHRICPPQDILRVPHRICYPQDNPHSCSPLWLAFVPHSRSPQDMSSTGYKVLWMTFTHVPHSGSPQDICVIHSCSPQDIPQLILWRTAVEDMHISCGERYPVDDIMLYRCRRGCGLRELHLPIWLPSILGCQWQDL